MRRMGIGRRRSIMTACTIEATAGSPNRADRAGAAMTGNITTGSKAGTGDSPSPKMAAIRSGIVGFESMTTRRWSASLLAAVFLMILPKQSRVAAGPIPPNMPITFPISL